MFNDGRINFTINDIKNIHRPSQSALTKSYGAETVLQTNEVTTYYIIYWEC